MTTYTFSRLPDKDQGQMGETFKYETEKATFFIKKNLEGVFFESISKNEQSLIKILNLIGIKTPTEMVLLSCPNPNADQPGHAKELYFIVKKEVANGESNKTIVPDAKSEKIQNTKGKTLIDIKWAIRDMAVSLLLNIIDINPMETHNTLPIIYPKKDSKIQKFIHYDPLIDELRNEVDEDNFFENLAHGPLRHAYFRNIENYLKDANSNTKKKKEILQYLQKNRFLLKTNKEKINQILNSFCSEEDKYKFGDLLSTNLTHLEKVLDVLSEKFKIKMSAYDPDEQNEKRHIAKRVPAAFGKEDLANIQKALKINELKIVDHFVASTIDNSKKINTLPKINNTQNKRENHVKLPPIKNNTHKTKNLPQKPKQPIPPIANTVKQSNDKVEKNNFKLPPIKKK